MSSRVLARFVSRKFSSSGKDIKKMEKEKSEKLARKGPTPEEKPPTGSGDSGSISEAKATGQTSSNSGVLTDKNQNYVFLAGVGGLGALGWYLQSKKPEEVQTRRERGMLKPDFVKEIRLQHFNWSSQSAEPHALLILSRLSMSGRLKNGEVLATLSSLQHVANTFGTSPFQDRQELIKRSNIMSLHRHQRKGGPEWSNLKEDVHMDDQTSDDPYNVSSSSLTLF